MTKNLHLVIWNDKSQCYNFYIKKMSNIKKKTALRQKPTNYIIRNKAKYVKQNRVNTDTYLPTISLICRCFSKVIKTVNIRFMQACVPLSSNWKRLDNRERRFRRTENGLPYIVLRSSLQICEEIQKRIAWTTQRGHGDKDHVTRTTDVDITNKNEHNQNQLGMVRWSRALWVMVPNRNCQFCNNYKKYERMWEQFRNQPDNVEKL